MRRPAAVAAAVFTAALLAFAVLVAVPWLERTRDFPSSVLTPPPLEPVVLDVVEPRGQLCMSDVAIEPHGDQARFRVGTYFKPGPPLVLTIRGSGGYSSVTRIRAGFADNAYLHVPVRPPPRAQLVTVCLRNLGRLKISVYSAFGRSGSRANVTIDGRRVGPTPTFAFYESRPVSIGDRLSTIVERMATFRGVFGHPWLFWALIALFVAGVPLLMGVALWRAFANPS
jgi:hypothetical protein